VLVSRRSDGATVLADSNTFTVQLRERFCLLGDIEFFI
jgi:hypothetical protein